MDERTSLKPIGVIGADAEALRLAQRLAASGRRVLVYAVPGCNVTNELSPPKVAGTKTPSRSAIERVATTADLACECAVVCLAVDDTARLRDVVIGTPDRCGLAVELAPGAILIDVGVRTPREIQALFGLVGRRGIGVVDAAIIGSAEALSRGTARVLTGGFPDAVEAVADILGELGIVERTGPLGSAQTVAALMGFVEAAHHEASADATSVGQALGLSPHTLSQLLPSEPDAGNVVRLRRRAEVARRIVEERGLGAEIISFARARPTTAHSDAR
ncbi:MAG: NAD(P)-binding domain-containing protein [Hyphomicrobium sp.]